MSKVKHSDDTPLGQPLRMRLAQKGLARAELVIWPMKKHDGEMFVDIRLWFSKEGTEQWMPSKKGVRVPAGGLRALIDLLDGSGGELLLADTAKRELRGRWMEDNVGRAFDLRYLVKTDSYTGWDKRGVRIRERDCRILRTHLVALVKNVGSLEAPQVTSPLREIMDARELLEVLLD